MTGRVVPVTTGVVALGAVLLGASVVRDDVRTAWRGGPLVVTGTVLVAAAALLVVVTSVAVRKRPRLPMLAAGVGAVVGAVLVTRGPEPALPAIRPVTVALDAGRFDPTDPPVPWFGAPTPVVWTVVAAALVVAVALTVLFAGVSPAHPRVVAVVAGVGAVALLVGASFLPWTGGIGDPARPLWATAVSSAVAAGCVLLAAVLTVVPSPLRRGPLPLALALAALGSLAVTRVGEAYAWFDGPLVAHAGVGLFTFAEVDAAPSVTELHAATVTVLAGAALVALAALLAGAARPAPPPATAPDPAATPPAAG